MSFKQNRRFPISVAVLARRTPIFLITPLALPLEILPSRISKLIRVVHESIIPASEGGISEVAVGCYCCGKTILLSNDVVVDV